MRSPGLPLLLPALVATALAVEAALVAALADDGLSRVVAERLNGGEPVVSARHFEEAGLVRPGATPNINGPSLIRVPDWIPPERRADPSARYYLYVGVHELRDPCLFRDEDGQYYLLYSGAGEEGIGLAVLRHFPPAE